MKAYVVIGANFGDEGKGLVTDYLCARHGAELCVRFNGGAQAGHTVVTPAGERRVFHHFGAGSFAGASTYLSRYFVCNPILYCDELKSFGRVRRPRVMVSINALVTTPYDMLVNQMLEKRRAGSRHGSCGVGVNETMRRCEADAAFRTTVSAMFDDEMYFDKMSRIRNEWLPARLKALGMEGEEKNREWFPQNDEDRLNFDSMFYHDVKTFRRNVLLTTVEQLKGARRVVFEGSQGLLLDQNRKEYFPHVTPSNTGSQNAVELAREMGAGDATLVYVTRPYVTRHGAGRIPDETDGRPYPTDETNVDNEFQGVLRYGRLDPYSLAERVCADAGALRAHVALTCLDHAMPGEEDFSLQGASHVLGVAKHSVFRGVIEPALVSCGRTRNDVRYASSALSD